MPDVRQFLVYQDANVDTRGTAPLFVWVRLPKFVEDIKVFKNQTQQFFKRCLIQEPQQTTTVQFNRSVAVRRVDKRSLYLSSTTSFNDLIRQSVTNPSSLKSDLIRLNLTVFSSD